MCKNILKLYYTNCRDAWKKKKLLCLTHIYCNCHLNSFSKEKKKFSRAKQKTSIAADTLFNYSCSFCVFISHGFSFIITQINLELKCNRHMLRQTPAKWSIVIIVVSQTFIKKNRTIPHTVEDQFTAILWNYHTFSNILQVLFNRE